AGAAWDAVLLSSEGRVRAMTGQVAERLKPFLLKMPVVGEALAVKPLAAPAIEEALATARESQDAMLAPLMLAGEDDAQRAFGIVLPREAFPQGLVTAFGLSSQWAEPLFAIVLLSTRDLQADRA